MKVLVIYTHPNPGSFNHALLEQVINSLKASGNDYEVVDLYGIKFDPLLKINDLANLGGGKTAKDILEQQQKVVEANVIIFIYPTWWGGMPGMLKGYLDRVFSIGFAYRMGRYQPEGLLGDKTVIIFRTTALSEEAYVTSGVENLIRTLSEYKFKVVCGIKALEHHVFYEVPSVSDDVRRSYLDQVKSISNQL